MSDSKPTSVRVTLAFLAIIAIGVGLALWFGIPEALAGTGLVSLITVGLTAMYERQE